MAVLVYLGVGVSSFPTRLPDALADYVGSDHAHGLRLRVDELLEEARVEPEPGDGLGDATRRVEHKVGASHPELSVDAVRALAWDFSYSTK
jgi:hypothetical protein